MTGPNDRLCIYRFCYQFKINFSHLSIYASNYVTNLALEQAIFMMYEEFQAASMALHGEHQVSPDVQSITCTG